MKSPFFRPLFFLILALFTLACGKTHSDTNRLRVLTLNTWLLTVPFKGDVSKDIPARLLLIPEVVEKTKADIVLFQEVWLEKYREKLAIALKNKGYRYAASDTEKPNYGNGLVIFSKLPIQEKSISVLKFTKRTRWDESFVSKGAIAATIEVPNFGDVTVVNTHLGATTYRAKEGSFDKGEVESRSSQLVELLDWIKKDLHKNEILLGGDFNNHWKKIEDGKIQKSLSEDYEKIIDAGFIDTFRTLNPDEKISGITTDTTGNPYSDNPLDPALKTQPSVVDDYIFLGTHSQLKTVSSTVLFQEEISIEMKEKLKLPTLPVRVSDHYAVLTEFQTTSKSSD